MRLRGGDASDAEFDAKSRSGCICGSSRSGSDISESAGRAGVGMVVWTRFNEPLAENHLVPLALVCSLWVG